MRRTEESPYPTRPAPWRRFLVLPNDYFVSVAAHADSRPLRQRGHHYGRTEPGAADELAGYRSGWHHLAAARHRRAAGGDVGAGPTVRAGVLPPAPILAHPTSPDRHERG